METNDRQETAEHVSAILGHTPNGVLMGADHIHFFVGQAVNPVHQNPELPHQLGIRLGVVREIAEELRSGGKEVTIGSI